MDFLIMLFIVDFDGTISKKDTIDALLEKFAPASWEEIEQSWLRGEIDAVECMSRQIGMVRGDRDALDAFFRQIELDQGFVPFYEYASRFGEVIVASDGVDHAIHMAFRHSGFPAVQIFSNRLDFTPEGIAISFPNRRADCQGGNGNCKCVIAREQSAISGGPVILIGDGKSDACIARQADVVFAKGKLIDYCEQQDIAYHPFSTFKDVLEAIRTWPLEHNTFPTAIHVKG
ncbi:MtnX-like HAD-IB family phosphatase [Methylovorus sp. SPW-M1]